MDDNNFQDSLCITSMKQKLSGPTEAHGAFISCQHDQLVGVYPDRLKNRGLRHGSGSKKGGLRHGSGQKGGSLLWHIPVLDIYASAPPPPPGGIFRYFTSVYNLQIGPKQSDGDCILKIFGIRVSFGCERSCSHPHIKFERDRLNIFLVRMFTSSGSTGGRGLKYNITKHFVRR